MLIVVRLRDEEGIESTCCANDRASDPRGKLSILGLWKGENLGLKFLKVLKILFFTFCLAKGITVSLRLSINPGDTELVPDTIMLS